jgi:hypothetical protein
VAVAVVVAVAVAVATQAMAVPSVLVVASPREEPHLTARRRHEEPQAVPWAVPWVMAP